MPDLDSRTTVPARAGQYPGANLNLCQGTLKQNGTPKRPVANPVPYPYEAGMFDGECGAFIVVVAAAASARMRW